MLSRIVVPANAQLGHVDTVPESVKGIHQAHLVPRRLIPANALLKMAPSEAPHQSGEPSQHRLLVGKLLVPAGARIGGSTGKLAVPASGAPAPHRLFDEALLTKPALGRKRTAADWLISLGIHAAIIAAVVIVPLFFTQAIDPHQLELTYLVAPPLPAAPAPPPPPAAAVAPRPAAKSIAPVAAELTMPIAIPKEIAKSSANDEVAEAAPNITGGVLGGVPGGVLGGSVGGLLGGIAGGIPGGSGLAAPPPPPAPPAVPSGPLQVGGSVKPPRLLHAVQPAYPVLAKQARVQGVVQIDAVIDENGNVVKEHAVSGSGILVPAALEAVSQWKYQPTYLNGKPYPVELEVDVTFQL